MANKEMEKKEMISMTNLWVAFWKVSDEPIKFTGSLGTYIPVWDNPMSAHDWSQTQSKTSTLSDYYVREVEVLFLAKRK